MAFAVVPLRFGEGIVSKKEFQLCGCKDFDKNKKVDNKPGGGKEGNLFAHPAFQKCRAYWNSPCVNMAMNYESLRSRCRLF